MLEFLWVEQYFFLVRAFYLPLLRVSLLLSLSLAGWLSPPQKRACLANRGKEREKRSKKKRERRKGKEGEEEEKNKNLSTYFSYQAPGVDQKPQLGRQHRFVGVKGGVVPLVRQKRDERRRGRELLRERGRCGCCCCCSCCCRRSRLVAAASVGRRGCSSSNSNSDGE